METVVRRVTGGASLVRVRVLVAGLVRVFAEVVVLDLEMMRVLVRVEVFVLLVL